MFKYFFNALEVLEETGSADAVFQFVERIQHQFDREDTFKKLAKFFARQGRIHEAEKFSAGIHDEIAFTHCLQEVARELRKKGYAEHGKRFLQESYERAIHLKARDIDKANLYLVLSVELHDAGRKEDAVALLRQAIELVNKAGGKVVSSKFLAACSEQLIKWNYPEDARKVAESIQENWFRHRALDQLEKKGTV